MSDEYINFMNNIVVEIDAYLVDQPKAENILYEQVKHFCRIYDNRLGKLIPILEKNYPQITGKFNITVALEIDGIPISALGDESHIRKGEGDLKAFDKYMEETCPGNGYYIAFEEGIPFGVSFKNEVDERIFWVPCWLPESIPDPMKWLPGYNRMILEPLPDDTRFMIDSTVLAVIHDETVGNNIGHIRQRMIYKSKKVESKHFDPKGWMQIYWFILKDDESLKNYIQIAWERIQKVISSKNNTKKYTKIPAKTQKLVIQESGGICSICDENNVATLEFHHIDGRDIPNPHAPENLIYVCKNCHGKIHDGQISKEEVLHYKNKYKNCEFANSKRQVTVQNIKFPGINYGIIAQNIKIQNGKQGYTKVLPPQGSIGSVPCNRNYLKYLIDRYHEFARIEKTGNYKYSIFYQSIKRKFGAKWDMIPLEHFGEVCSYVQSRIDKTVFGKNQKKKEIRRYNTFEEYNEKY